MITARGRRSVEEVPDAGEVEADAGLLGGGDDLFVADRTAGLDDGAHARRGEHLEAVREREVRVRSADRGTGPVARAGYRQPGRVDPVDLAHADPDRGSAGGQQDRVGLDRAAGLPGEGQVAHGRLVSGLTRPEF